MATDALGSDHCQNSSNAVANKVFLIFFGKFLSECVVYFSIYEIYRLSLIAHSVPEENPEKSPTFVQYLHQGNCRRIARKNFLRKST